MKLLKTHKKKKRELSIHRSLFIVILLTLTTLTLLINDTLF